MRCAARGLWAVRDVAIVLVVYAIARWCLVAWIGDAGVLTPSQSVDGWRVGAALALLVMRLTILIAVPLVIGYRLARHFIPRLASRLRAR